MTKRNLIVIGTGLVILIIVVVSTYQNYRFAKLARAEVNVLKTQIQQRDDKITELYKLMAEANTAIQQKDIDIAKLNKEIKSTPVQAYRSLELLIVQLCG